jgi:predicted RNA methylase
MASKDISERLNGKSVLELGAGCGVPGLAAALYRYVFYFA